MNFAAHFHNQLASNGHHTVTFLPEHDNPQSITFSDLDRQARTIAAHLTAQGCTDQPVVLLYPAGVDFIAAFLGCLYARVLAIPAPMPHTSPQHQAHLQALIHDAAARLVLTTPAHREQLTALLPGIPVHTTHPQANPPPWTAPQITPSTIAFVQYTSGSTSAPRGVQVPHSALLHNLGGIHALATDPPHLLTGWLPHYHDMGLIGLQLHALYTGTDLVFTAPTTFIARPYRWLQMISDYRADWTAAPNFGYDLCTRRITDTQLAGLDLSCLHAAHTGSEPIKASTITAFTHRFAPTGFRHTAWAPAYGMAEATLMITATRQGTGAVIRTFDPTELQHDHANPAPEGTPLVASGRPIDLDVRITDPTTGATRPDGHIGEIWVAGASVAAGYRHQPDATQHTFHAGTGSHLRTGDLGFLLDGDLYITGRLKDIIIVNGRNLYPQDIEETARLAHPATGLAAAFTLTAPGGSEHVVLVAELRPHHPAPEEIASTITAAIGSEFGISINLILVPAGGVPRTTSGKIRRRHTRTLFSNAQLTHIHQQLHPTLTTTPPT